MIQRFRNTSINVHTYLTDPLSYFYCDCWRIEERKEKRNENKEEQIKKREEEITKKKNVCHIGCNGWTRSISVCSVRVLRLRMIRTRNYSHWL